MNEYIADSTDKLAEIAGNLIQFMNETSNIVLFYGEMGAGKTTFVKYICELLGVQDRVSSPTFAIINEYVASNDDAIYHFDFYRLNKPEEAFEIGYHEYFFSQNICLVEWPEKISALLPDNYVEVHIEVIDENTRKIWWKHN